MNTNTGEIFETMQQGLDAGVKKSHLMPIEKLTPIQRINMKIGRNDPCPCGSGKKFKHCHLGKPV